MIEPSNSSNSQGSNVNRILIIVKCFLGRNFVTGVAVDRSVCFDMTKVKVSNLSQFYVYLQDVMLNQNVITG